MQSVNKVVHALFLIAAAGGMAFYAMSERPAGKESKGKGRTYSQQAEADTRRRLDEIQQQIDDSIQRNIEIGRRATGR